MFYENNGHVTTETEGFYGLDTKALNEYIAAIKAAVISKDGDSAVARLELNKEKLFEGLREGWTGSAEAMFEKRINTAIKNTVEVLDDLESRLEGYLKAIANAWIDQDKNMIGE